MQEGRRSYIDVAQACSHEEFMQSSFRGEVKKVWKSAADFKVKHCWNRAPRCGEE